MGMSPNFMGAANSLATAYGGDGFPNPFLDVATLSMPRGWRTALYFAEHLFLRDGGYAQAIEKLISYFLTDIDFKDAEASDDEKEKWEDFLVETLDIYGSGQSALRNLKCYGNGFTSVVVPFRRFLSCPQCGLLVALSEMYVRSEFQFSWSNMQFVGTCPRCKIGANQYKGVWKTLDLEDDPEHKMYVKHWPVHEMEILHDLYTDQCAYLWRIPEDYKSQVRKGHLYHLERCPEPVLEAIRKNQMFRFDDDVIYHMKEPTICGIRTRGWGIPLALRNFRQMFYVQVLRRYNEAIALDYVIPFRLLSPMPRPGAGGSGAVGQTADPLMTFNMNDFTSSMTRMLRRRRFDPASFQVSPYPVQFQMLGGDAAKLAPVELLGQGQEDFLNAIGMPVEMFRGTLAMQVAPVALRLFESTNHSLVHSTNDWMRWLSRQSGQVLKWQPLKPQMRRVTMADDIQKQMMQMQMYMGQELSGTTAFKAVGADWKQEQRRLGDEALFQAAQKKKVDETMQQAGFAADMAKGNLLSGPGGAPQMTGPGGAPQQGGGGGAPAPGGAPGGGGGPVDQYLASKAEGGMSPPDMVEAAEGIANDLLGTPSSLRRAQLQTLKAKDEAMYAFVKDKLQKIRSSARSQGQQAVMQQQYGQT